MPFEIITRPNIVALRHVPILFNFDAMSLWIRFLFFALAICVSAALAGCMPDQSQSDDEKEPHFVLGQSRMNAMDFQGAAEAFEEAIEVNPHSAPAHYQLAMLYDTRVPDPAAAIYNYQEYLKYDPNAPNASIIQQRIEACKQQLAADVLSLPSSSATQQQLEKLIEQNRALQDQVEKWQAYYAAQQAALTNQQNLAPVVQTPVAIRPTQPAQLIQTHQDQPPVRTSPVDTQPVVTSPNSSFRSHTVAQGETAAAIARHAGIKLSALAEANPGVNLGHIRVGQVLKIP
jgi:tetratricopeptide (TPR) repeat protein